MTDPQNQTNDTQNSNKKEVFVDEKCISCGVCLAICPEIFEFNETGKSHVKKGKEIIDTNDELYPKVEDAMNSCPVGAIHIVDAKIKSNEENKIVDIEKN